MRIKEILSCVCCDHIPDVGDSVYYGMPQLKVSLGFDGKQWYEPYCPQCGRGGFTQYDSAYHALKAWNELQIICRRLFDNPFERCKEEKR